MLSVSAWISGRLDTTRRVLCVVIAHGGHEIAPESYLTNPRGWLLCPYQKKRHTPSRAFMYRSHDTNNGREEGDDYPREQGCDGGGYRQR